MTQEEKILSDLNDQQKLAVKQVDGPIMVLAGAGSGKTRVLTYRIAYMLAKKVNPYGILALTFTNKAAAEMRARIVNLVGGTVAKAVTMGTFHSVFYRILRADANKLGFSHNFTIYDTDDSKSLIKNIVKEMNLDPKVYAPSQVQARISSAKSSLLSAQEYANNHEIIAADSASGKPHIHEIFQRYNNRLRHADAMDFDDLLYYMNILLRDFPDMLYKYQNRFSHILVDEYQDTNFAQYLIVKKLAALNQNICVVGDDAQSIYGFRGADIQNILNFRRDYPSAQIYKLEQNFRSTQNIVNAANEVIRKNRDQMPKNVWTDNDEGSKINLIRSQSDNEEASFVANSIFETRMNKHVAYKQFAILYRTNIQSRTLEEAMIKRNIPYKILGGLSFYKRKEIKDILAYFRLTINHYDEESLRRVINYPMRGIGDTTIAKIAVAAQENNCHFWDVVNFPQKYGLSISSAIIAKLEEFSNMIKSFSARLKTLDAYELGKEIAIKSGIAKVLKENAEEKERVDHLEELLDSIKGFTEKGEPEHSVDERTGEVIEQYFPSLDQFLESIALVSDDEEKKDSEKEEDRVKMMTIHSAKGLEFDYVFITGMEENLFPSAMCSNTRQEMEEERRLFYVALTRARKEVTLSCAQTRYRFGSLQFCEESRFLEDIPEKFLNIKLKASDGRGTFSRSRNSEWTSTRNSFMPTRTTEKRNTSTFAPHSTIPQRPQLKSKADAQLDQMGALASFDQIRPGVRIYHNKFGYGIVQSTSGEGADTKASIRFDTVGNKILLLKFAKLIMPK